MVRSLVIAALLLVASTCYGQLIYATFTYLPENGPALTTACNGSTPIPDGRLVKIFWDVDSDGPDQSDPLAPLCDNPPECPSGPPGTMSYNQFTTNGIEYLGVPGYFMCPFYLESSISNPNPARFYLRIYEADGTNYLWTSIVMTLPASPIDFNLVRADWTCGTGGPQCVVRDEHE
jgi:hypothetical protein